MKRNGLGVVSIASAHLLASAKITILKTYVIDFVNLRTLKSNWMSSTNKIRSGLIYKILSIKNRDFLEALDQLVSTSSSESEIVELFNE